jgi:non-ribosomal peptide synthase protein (TIGR01720 family)
VPPRTPTEKILATIWAEVLELQQVGIHDNFFSIGGDSIMSLLVISKAHSHGLTVSTRDLFESQTIERLAPRVGRERPEQQGLVEGTVTLTPIVHRFLEQSLAHPSHFNQSVLLQASGSLDEAALNACVTALLLHHDALRLRLEPHAQSWRLWLSGVPEDGTPVTRIDLSAIPAERHSETLTRVSAQAQASLDIRSGPLVRVIWFDSGPTGAHQLLIISHHLAVDGVSWRILLEDLERAYSQYRDGGQIELPAKTTSFQDWSRKLAEYARLPVLEAERPYWSRLARYQPAALLLPRALQSANTFGSRREVTLELSEQETADLLQRVPAAYHTSLDDVLLTALAIAHQEETAEPVLFIDLESHGREDLFTDVNLSRTVGWFTALYPVMLEIPGTDLPLECLKSIKEQLRAVPHHGIGFGLLRYLCPDPGVNSEMEGIARPRLCFNNLGQFQARQTTQSLFKPRALSARDTQDPGALRSYELEVQAWMMEGQLNIQFIHGAQLQSAGQLSALISRFSGALRQLISLCSQPTIRGFTPSDFPGTQLEQQELDELLERFDVPL